MKQLAILSLCTLMFIGVVTVCGVQELVLHLPLDELSGDVAAGRVRIRKRRDFQGQTRVNRWRFGKAVAFDGKTSAQIPDHASLDIVEAITIEFWVFIEGGEAIQSGVEKGAAWVSGLYNLAALYNGGTILQFFDLPDACNDENIGPSIQDGEWHFLAGTWDGDTIRLYIDGELEADMACKGKLSPNDDALFIGARGGSGRFLTGALDEIKMYNYALTKEELLADMEQPFALAVDARDKLATTWARLKSR